MLLVIVGLVLALVARACAQVDYSVPVSVGNAPITNADEVLAEAERQFDAAALAAGGRVARSAGCYFFRPLGTTQGPGLLPPALIPGGADALDILLCGPAQLGSTPPESPPWQLGVVTYRAQPDGSFHGTFHLFVPTSLLEILDSVGGVRRELLWLADGRHPPRHVIEDGSWHLIERITVSPPPAVGAPPPPADVITADLGQEVLLRKVLNPGVFPWRAPTVFVMHLTVHAVTVDVPCARRSARGHPLYHPQQKYFVRVDLTASVPATSVGSAPLVDAWNVVGPEGVIDSAVHNPLALGACFGAEFDRSFESLEPGSSFQGSIYLDTRYRSGTLRFKEFWSAPSVQWRF